MRVFYGLIITAVILMIGAGVLSLCGFRFV